MTRTPVLSTAAWLLEQWRRGEAVARRAGGAVGVAVGRGVEDALTWRNGWWL